MTFFIRQKLDIDRQNWKIKFNTNKNEMSFKNKL